MVVVPGLIKVIVLPLIVATLVLELSNENAPGLGLVGGIRVNERS